MKKAVKKVLPVTFRNEQREKSGKKLTIKMMKEELKEIEEKLIPLDQEMDNMKSKHIFALKSNIAFEILKQSFK